MLRLNIPVADKAVRAICSICLAIMTDVGGRPGFYVLRVALVNTALSGLLAMFVQLSGGDFSGSPFGVNYSPGGKAATIFLVLIASPIVETYIMARLIRIIGFALDGKGMVAIISAGFFAILHAIVNPAWGIIVFPAFYTMSLSYLVLVRHSGRKVAFWGVAAMHSLQNIPGAISFVFSGV